ncbi:hypothetical protein BSZ14_03960 [Sphingomonas sp. Sph1(2015)]|nr:hypothetical protein BSZ14_03960 [Sphingomonas sp. Sph1(2015)]
MRRFIGNRYGVTITAAVLRAALLAFGLPLFVPFFWPLSVRIAAVALVALAWGLWRYLRRRAAAPPRRAAAVPPAGSPMRSPPNWRDSMPPMRKASHLVVD